MEYLAALRILTLSDSLQNLDPLPYISQVQGILVVSTGVLPDLS